MKEQNNMCSASLVLGIISIFLYNIVIIPILSIILGIIGINSFNIKKHNNKWMGTAGLILGILYFGAYLVYYGVNKW